MIASLAIPTLLFLGPQDTEPDAAPAPAPTESAQESSDESAEESARPQDRSGYLARDARVAFSPTSALRARNDLAAGLPAGYPRAIALLAVACGGSIRDIALIEEYAGEGEDRRAGLLALGEIGEGGAPALLRFADEDVEPELAEALTLALLRSGSPDARSRLRELAAGGGALADAADVLLPFLEGRALPDLPIVDELYDLRWQAGRHYGRVDGQRRRTVLVQELATQRDFLDRVLLEATLERDTPAAYEHLLEMVKADRGVGAVRAAATALPAALADWIIEGVWEPADLDEWRGILDSIQLHEIEADSLDLLQLAFAHEELAPLAGLLILRGGGPLPERWAEREIAAADGERRVALFEALGQRGDFAYAPTLVGYLDEDPDPRVRAAALVALRRLGTEDSLRTIDQVLGGGPSEMRTEVVVALAKQAHVDAQVRAHLRDAGSLADLTPRARVAAELGLARIGLLSDRSDLRQRLITAPPRERRILVRVLAENAEEEDIELFRRLFPVEGDLEVNVELAIALVRHRDQAMAELLRRLLWRADWNQSVLAGGLMIRAGGMHTLLDELDIPPSTASDRDRRRVGFALGQWAGLSAVEALARRRTETDPALQGAYLGALASQTR